MTKKMTARPTRAHMGEQLEAILREKNMRQSDLAARIGWSRQRLSIKVGTERWDADTTFVIAQALQVPTDRFFFAGEPKTLRVID
ncbi:MAG: helix-turn-helix transcriptional regulator [Nitrospira sp.]